jgi:hypothetical protein
MSKHLLLSASLFIACAASAQTAFWADNFGSGCDRGMDANTYSGTMGPWTEASSGTNDTHADLWFVSATASGTGAQNCSDNCIVNTVQNRTLHIGNAAVMIPNTINIGEDTGSTYLTGAFCGFGICNTTNKRIESPVINCVGRTSIGVSFLYYEGGEFMGDEATLVYSPDGGVTWTQIDQLAKISASCTVPGGLWTEFSVALPASADNNANVKIGFNWTNDNDGVGTDPSFAVDDVTILENFPLAITPLASQQVSLVTEGNGVTVNAQSNTWELVSVVDVTGREIATTISGNQILFTEPNGMYFITISVNGEERIYKVMFTK